MANSRPEHNPAFIGHSAIPDGALRYESGEPYPINPDTVFVNIVTGERTTSREMQAKIDKLRQAAIERRDTAAENAGSALVGAETAAESPNGQLNGHATSNGHGSNGSVSGSIELGGPFVAGVPAHMNGGNGHHTHVPYTDPYDPGALTDAFVRPIERC
jgi:hypothetical protein